MTLNYIGLFLFFASSSSYSAHINATQSQPKDNIVPGTCATDYDCMDIDSDLRCCPDYSTNTITYYCCENECDTDYDCMVQWYDDWDELRCCVNEYGKRECCTGDSWIEQNLVAFIFIMIGSAIFLIILIIVLCCLIPACWCSKRRNKNKTVVMVEPPPPTGPASIYPEQQQQPQYGGKTIEPMQ